MYFNIDYRATLTIQTWTGWSDFFNYAIKGKEKRKGICLFSVYFFLIKVTQKL